MAAPSQHPETASSSPTIPGGGLVAIAAASVAIATILPWFEVDFSKLGSVFPAGAGFGDTASVGAADMMGAVMQQMTGNRTMTARGVDTWVGVIGLIAGIAAAVMVLLEMAGAQVARQSTLLLGTFLAGVASVIVTVVALTDLGGPVGIHVGLVVMAIASGLLAVVSFRRLRQFGEQQRAAAGN